MTIRLGYVVLHYRFDELTDACLSSLAAHADGAPVLVVDNGSPDPYRPRAADLVRIPENRCLAAAMNIGTNSLLERGDVDVAVQLNNDIVLTSATHTQLAWAFESTSRLAAAAPVMDQPDAGFMYQECPYPPGPEAEEFLASKLGNKQLELVPFVDNAAFAISGAAWADVGHLEERFTGASWGANYDYCWRARQAGWQIGLVRSAFVFHRHRATWGRLDPAYAARAAQRMMAEMRLVWGDLADTVSCREFIWQERDRLRLAAPDQS